MSYIHETFATFFRNSEIQKFTYEWVIFVQEFRNSSEIREVGNSRMHESHSSGIPEEFRKCLMDVWFAITRTHIRIHTRTDTHTDTHTHDRHTHTHTHAHTHTHTHTHTPDNGIGGRNSWGTSRGILKEYREEFLRNVARNSSGMLQEVSEEYREEFLRNLARSFWGISRGILEECGKEFLRNMARNSWGISRGVSEESRKEFLRNVACVTWEYTRLDYMNTLSVWGHICSRRGTYYVWHAIYATRWTHFLCEGIYALGEAHMNSLFIREILNSYLFVYYLTYLYASWRIHVCFANLL